VPCKVKQNVIKMLTINPLTPKLNPSAQCCLTRLFTGDFAFLTMHFLNICVINQQMQQLLIQYINYVWYLLHVSELHCYLQGALLVPSERCSIEDQSIEYCGWAFFLVKSPHTMSLDTTRSSTIFYRLLLN
jgi:hypothetical protein